MSDASTSRPPPHGGRSTLISRNVTVGGHRTSVRLEPAMWDAFAEICRIERLSLHVLCTEIDRRREPGMSLTSAIRVFLMAYFRAAATEDGHRLAGHGTGRPFLETPFAGPHDDRNRLPTRRALPRPGRRPRELCDSGPSGAVMAD